MRQGRTDARAKGRGGTGLKRSPHSDASGASDVYAKLTAFARDLDFPRDLHQICHRATR
jgi:hypothetical protein